MQYKIFRLRDKPVLKERADQWFHEKWGIPLAAYQENMDNCLSGTRFIPQWYVAMDDTKIIGGLGMIDNDFHDRKDLTPNICAVYVEEEYRRQGIAGALLQDACTDAKENGVDTLYLVTDHTSFYERYGWEFFCMVQGDGETKMSRMYMHRS